ncbi:4-alpha-glucanotransferase [Bremerella cremea]|uniref:4-alpha-glucanotransferase n=1 Tax=Bremerella cremea TaxID=1031537 RepID=UPI0031EBA8F4
MSDDCPVAPIPPFPDGYRAAGILMHITSLASPHGIGDFGPSAIQWIDLLHDAGQSWWQVLPLGPTGDGNSPYLPLSSFAMNEVLVSPEWLLEDGLISADDCQTSWPDAKVDFDNVNPYKYRLLETAWDRYRAEPSAELADEFEAFKLAEGHWLDDYTLFRALKNQFQGDYYLDWPAELAERKPEALLKARTELAEQCEKFAFFQYLLHRYGMRVRNHARDKGVRLIGDVPIYVSADSSDVWANPELFSLDEHKRPKFVAGVPPDYFSAVGQLWGNPVYNWEAHRQTGYRWFIQRFRSLLTYADAIRLDHFRGFAAAWHVAADAKTAEVGYWAPGPGAKLFEATKAAIGNLPFIVEDLGTITEDVWELRDQFDMPGTRVVQFAFDGDPDNLYLPKNYVANTTVYTGTHDNATSRQWYEELPEDARETVWRSLQMPAVSEDEVAWALLQAAWQSVAALAIAPLQDVLNLGSDSRMNVPGESEGNWDWRCPANLLSSPYFSTLAQTTKDTGRWPE